MKRKEFYTELISAIKGSIDGLNEKDKEIAKLKGKISSGRYSQSAIDEMHGQIRAIEIESEQYKESRIAEVRKLTSKMKAALTEETALKGKDITADAELLKYNLSADELVGILGRYESNPTMTQLILKSAKDRGLDLGVYFTGNTEEIKALDSIEYPFTVVMRYRDQPDIFNRLFGEGTQLDLMFNTDDPPPAVSLSYTDERIANAVKVLEDNKDLSPTVQADIIKEFAEHKTVLPILRNAAVKGRNFEAKDLIDSIITTESAQE